MALHATTWVISERNQGSGESDPTLVLAFRMEESDAGRASAARWSGAQNSWASSAEGLPARGGPSGPERDGTGGDCGGRKEWVR